MCGSLNQPIRLGVVPASASGEAVLNVVVPATPPVGLDLWIEAAWVRQGQADVSGVVHRRVLQGAGYTPRTVSGISTTRVPSAWVRLTRSCQFSACQPTRKEAGASRGTVTCTVPSGELSGPPPRTCRR